MKAKHRMKGYAVLAIIIAALLLAYYYLPDFRNFASPTFVREYLLGLGNWGYLVYVILFLLSILLPLPSTPVAIAGGYVFGVWMGTLLTMIGTIIGGSIAFLLIRYYGEPLLEKVVSKHHLHHFNHIFRKRGTNGAIIALAIPAFPSDAVEFMLGLTKIRYRAFLLVIILGNIPRSLLIVALGDQLYTGFTIQAIIIPILAVLFVLMAVFRERIKKIVFKELRFAEHEIEKDLVWVEGEVGMKKKLPRLSKCN